MDVNKLISEEKFFYADCVIIDDDSIIEFKVKKGSIELLNGLSPSELETTDIFNRFILDYKGSTYCAGEAAAHGSCGFFYKKTGNILDWALVSTESEPFIEIIISNRLLNFRSQSGATWIVSNDDIRNLIIQY